MPTWAQRRCARHLILESRKTILAEAEDGGRDRDRTCDPYHVKVVLSR